MKRIVSFLMAIVMCVTMTFVAPRETKAENAAVDCTQYVYHVSTFEELEKAITESEYKVDDFKHNRTIILDADIVGMDLAKDYCIEIADGKTVVLDLNNHKIDIVSEKTNVLFRLMNESKVYFMNGKTRTDPSQGAINFSINNRNDRNSLALVYVDSNKAEISSYDVNYTFGKPESNESYVTKNNYSAVFWLNQAKNVMISGGTILNYYSKGNAIRVQKSVTEIDKIEVTSNTVMNTGDSAIVVASGTNISKINISDATIKSMKADVPRIQELTDNGTPHDGISISKYIATPYQGTTNATVSKVGGTQISPTEIVNNLKYDLVFSLIGDDWNTCQTYLYKEIIVPAGHLWMCYETNGFSNIIPHNEIQTKEENFVDASCTKNGSYDRIQYCRECNGTVSKEQILTDKLDHDFTNNAEKCLKCGADNPNYKAPAPVDPYDPTDPTCKHEVTEVKTTSATCQKEGKVETVCTSCGELISTTSISKTAHSFGTNEPKCMVCGADNPNYKKEDVVSNEKPKATKVTKVAAKKKALTIKWKKQTKQTSGYELQVSTKKNFKGAKKVTVKKNKTTSVTVKKLKAKKKYYVRIRTYKTVKMNGKSKKLYSNWSKAVTKKTK